MEHNKEINNYIIKCKAIFESVYCRTHLQRVHRTTLISILCVNVIFLNIISLNLRNLVNGIDRLPKISPIFNSNASMFFFHTTGWFGRCDVFLLTRTLVHLFAQQHFQSGVDAFDDILFSNGAQEFLPTYAVLHDIDIYYRPRSPSTEATDECRCF